MQQKKYYISVGEPWNFDSPDGQNIINGVIVKILSAWCLLFKADYILDFNGVSGRVLVLYPRHADSNFDDLQKDKEYLAVNGNLLTEEYNEYMSEDYLKEKSKFVIIGGIRK